MLCVPVEEALKSEICGISQEKKFCENREGSIFLGDHERCRGLRKTMSPGQRRRFRSLMSGHIISEAAERRRNRSDKDFWK